VQKICKIATFFREKPTFSRLTGNDTIVNNLEYFVLLLCRTDWGEEVYQIAKKEEPCFGT